MDLKRTIDELCVFGPKFKIAVRDLAAAIGQRLGKDIHPTTLTTTIKTFYPAIQTGVRIRDSNGDSAQGYKGLGLRSDLPPPPSWKDGYTVDEIHMIEALSTDLPRDLDVDKSLMKRLLTYVRFIIKEEGIDYVESGRNFMRKLDQFKKEDLVQPSTKPPCKLEHKVIGVNLALKEPLEPIMRNYRSVVELRRYEDWLRDADLYYQQNPNWPIGKELPKKRQLFEERKKAATLREKKTYIQDPPAHQSGESELTYAERFVKWYDDSILALVTMPTTEGMTSAKNARLKFEDKYLTARQHYAALLI